MASVPITSWEVDGETVETVSDFIFCGSKITADGDCSHEIKKTLTFTLYLLDDHLVAAFKQEGKARNTTPVRVLGL